MAATTGTPYASSPVNPPPRPPDNLLLILCALLMHDLFLIAKFLVFVMRLLCMCTT